MIASQQMTAFRMDCGAQNRLILLNETQTIRQGNRGRRFIGDFDLLYQPVQINACIGGIEVALRLVDRIGRTHQCEVSEAPQRPRRRHIGPPCGRKEDVGVEEGAVGLQRGRGATCGTASGSSPSTFTSWRATSYSAFVAALFRRNSAFRSAV